MKGNHNYSKTRGGQKGPSAEDRALEVFADMMISKIETISKDWKKPWFTEGSIGWPKNLLGREYNGMNALMLLLHCEDKGYKLPIFCTFDRVQKLNEDTVTVKKTKHGTTFENDHGSERPAVLINKGEKSFPVMLTTFTCIHKETREKIRYEDWKQLSKEEQDGYDVFPRWQVFRVFNVAQTNLREARPDYWARLERENAPEARIEGEGTEFAPMDVMVRDGRWICPITPKHQDRAYFSMSRNEIVVPEKSQFKDGESYYGTLWHEMTHSTGVEGQLNRIKPAAFGSEDYAREELVAELGSALVAQRYGMSKALEEENGSYLKAWLRQLHEDPKYIKTVLLDVKRAAAIITRDVDEIAREIN